MNANEAKVRIAELAASLTKLEMEKRPAHFMNSSDVDAAFVKHYDTIFNKVAAS
ncbi:hypothetical protein [Pantoea septica]|uniref:hypothetical protein n=1 Tax=Pantoea TaxID=53335 RepID=UPI002FDB32D4